MTSRQMPKLWKTSFTWPEVAEHISTIRGYPIEKASVWCICIDFDTFVPETCSANEAYCALLQSSHVNMEIEIGDICFGEDSQPFEFDVYISESLWFKFYHTIHLGVREYEMVDTSIGVYTVQQ